MSKNLYTFAVLAGTAAHNARRIVDEHPEITNAQTGTKQLAAFERGDSACMHAGPTHELNAIIHDALEHEGSQDIAYHRAILDTWNNTALDLLQQLAERWPEFENDWATFVATGVAFAIPEHRNWLKIQRLDDHDIHAMTEHLEPAAHAGRAFLNAMFDWLDACRAVNGVGIVTAQTLGPSMGDAEYMID